MEIQTDVSSVMKRFTNEDVTEEMEEKAELAWTDWSIEYAKKENARVNTGCPVSFESTEIRIEPVEDPLRIVNEITFHGGGDITMEFYENGDVKILSTEPLNLKRIYWNKITSNYIPRIRAGFNSRNKEGAIVMRIEDSDYNLHGHPLHLVTLPLGTVEKDVDQLMKPYLNAYREERYGTHHLMSDQWVIHGAEIRFINKKNTGNLIIYNRSFHTRQLLASNMIGHIHVQPYMRYNVDSGLCKKCGK